MDDTKGPWFVFLRNPENGMLHVGPSWHSVAWIIQRPNERAIASLIAAAPDLLAFAHDVTTYCNDPKLVREAYALITKAKGEAK